MRHKEGPPRMFATRVPWDSHHWRASRQYHHPQVMAF